MYFFLILKLFFFYIFRSFVNVFSGIICVITVRRFPLLPPWAMFKCYINHIIPNAIKPSAVKY